MLETIKMKSKIYYLLFLSALFVQSGYSYSKDTIPPAYTWISPEEFSILTTNTIRLCVDARDNENGSGIKKVEFFARYYDYKGRLKQRHLIGEVNSFPYEFVWDCSHISDQNFGKLLFYCEVTDHAGNVIDNAAGRVLKSGPRFVLDRNKKLNDVKLLSHKINKDIIIDGILNEWAKKDSILFTNNDNKIIVYSIWNRKNLFFGIRVEDKSIISSFGPGSEETTGMSEEDDIEIFLDVDNDHSEICNFPDRQFLISAAGMIYEIKHILNDIYTYEKNLIPNVEFEVKVNGTLNDENDNDCCYIIELAVPWEELGVKPEEKFSMGLEIWNTDKNYAEGNYYYSGWTTDSANLKNPSEWGDIVFTGSNVLYKKAIAVVCVALFGAAIFLIAKKTNIYRKEEKNSHIPEKVEKEYIRKARRYIEENYSNETLSRNEVAQFISMEPSYFGKIFKKEIGKNFTDYLIHFRIEKAKELLLNTSKNISEIAFEVGFNSQSYFGYLFKKNENKSPGEFLSSNHKR